MVKRLPVLVLAMLMNNAMAANQVSVAPGELAIATISAKDPTRLSIKGGRIARLLGGDGKITGTADAEAGDVYITPTASYRSTPFSLFVKDDQGHVARLLLTPVEGPAEDIELTLSRVDDSLITGQGGRVGHFDTASDWEIQHPYEKGVLNLIRHMANYALHKGASELPSGYGTIVVDRRISLWRETDIDLWVRFQGVHFMGEIYRLKNTTNDSLIFQEKEFYRSGILAISLEKMQLAPRETGYLYIVRTTVIKGDNDSEKR